MPRRLLLQTVVESLREYRPGIVIHIGRPGHDERNAFGKQERSKRTAMACADHHALEGAPPSMATDLRGELSCGYSVDLITAGGFREHE